MILPSIWIIIVESTTRPSKCIVGYKQPQEPHYRMNPFCDRVQADMPVNTRSINRREASDILMSRYSEVCFCVCVCVCVCVCINAEPLQVSHLRSSLLKIVREYDPLSILNHSFPAQDCLVG